MVTARRAFTVVELIAVIAILLVLMGLVIALYPTLQRSLRRARTASILATLATAIESAGASQAKNAAPVEHPLCGSAEPRLVWLRADPTTATPATGGEALRVARLSAVPSAQERVLLDDDVFADPALPRFIGLPRARLGVLGAASPLTTRWRALPDPGPTQTLAPPYAPPTYDDERHLVRPALVEWEDGGFRQLERDAMGPAWEAAIERLMTLVLGPAAEQLAAMGALHRPDPVRDPLIAGGRVREDRDPAQAAQRAKAGATVLDDGARRPYRLRGPAVYDAWGREVLFSIVDGAVRLESGGADGCFRFAPGANGVVDSDPRGTLAQGDDRPGELDNVVVGGR